jgi:hypothetical protein
MFRAVESIQSPLGFIVRFEGTAKNDHWQNTFPFNKHTGHRKEFEAWAEDIGVEGYKVEPESIVFANESDATLALIAWK